MLNKPHMNPSFLVPFRAQLSLLSTINSEIKEKLSEITLTETNRAKRGAFNFLGSIWKTITGNLDASDGDFYYECINKLEKDDKDLQLLMKNQIQIISSTIKTFNGTLRNLRIDEETFNDNLNKIEKEMKASEIQNIITNCN